MRLKSYKLQGQQMETDIQKMISLLREIIVIIYFILINEMKSLISILWQFEVLGFRIPPTILKNHKQIAHHYFYSEKQNKILRKKNPDAVKLLEQNQSKQNEKAGNIVSIERNEKNNSISAQFIQVNNCVQKIEQLQFQGQFVLLPCGCDLVLVCFGIGQTVKFQYLTSQQPLRPIEHQILKFINNLSNQLINGIDRKTACLQKNSFEKQTRIKKENKIKRLSLIIGVNWRQDHQQFQLIIVDAVKLQFMIQPPHIVQILYEPCSKNKLTKTVLNEQKGPTQKQEKNRQQQVKLVRVENKLEQMDLKKEEKEGKERKGQYFQCKICGNEERNENCKQICNEDFKQIRKLKSLPIRGFAQDYYEVCMMCYSLL